MHQFLARGIALNEAELLFIVESFQSPKIKSEYANHEIIRIVNEGSGSNYSVGRDFKAEENMAIILKSAAACSAIIDRDAYSRLLPVLQRLIEPKNTERWDDHIKKSAMSALANFHARHLKS